MYFIVDAPGLQPPERCRGLGGGFVGNYYIIISIFARALLLLTISQRSQWLDYWGVGQRRFDGACVQRDHHSSRELHGRLNGWFAWSFMKGSCKQAWKSAILRQYQHAAPVYRRYNNLQTNRWRFSAVFIITFPTDFVFGSLPAETIPPNLPLHGLAVFHSATATRYLHLG